MNTTFEPRNDLEMSLLAAQEGRIAGEQLMESYVYMPTFEKPGNKIANIQLDSKAKPLSIKNDTGKEFLILLTSPEIATEFVKGHPGYDEGGLPAEFTWIPEKMGVGFGISLNPGQEAGPDLEPEAIKQISAIREDQ